MMSKLPLSASGTPVFGKNDLGMMIAMLALVVVVVVSMVVLVLVSVVVEGETKNKKIGEKYWNLSKSLVIFVHLV